MESEYTIDDLKLFPLDNLRPFFGLTLKTYEAYIFRHEFIVILRKRSYAIDLYYGNIVERFKEPYKAHKVVKEVSGSYKEIATELLKYLNNETQD